MRLQLHAGFTFADAARLVPYLSELGVSHLYASPILTARAGSMHGYDVVDPTRVNPELGGEAGLRDLVAALRAAGLGIIVDIVPNHMAVGGDDNAWWMDVLAPRPGQPLRQLLRHRLGPGRPRPARQAAGPVPRRALRRRAARPATCARSAMPPTPRSSRYSTTPSRSPRTIYAESRGRGLATPTTPHTEDGRASGCTACWSASTIGWPGGARPATRSTGGASSTSTALAGMRVERPDVFEATHAMMLRLYAEGLIDGVRVDHVDGLADPRGYCRKLRRRLEALTRARPAERGRRRPISWSKRSLRPAKRLPADWLVDGTTGYDFMDQVSARAARPGRRGAADRVLDRAHRPPGGFRDRGAHARGGRSCDAVRRRSSRRPRTRACTAWPAPTRRHATDTQPAIRRALIELLAHFPVYRTYNAGARPVAGATDARSRRALAGAKAAIAPPPTLLVLDLIDRWLGGEGRDAPGAQRRAACARRAVPAAHRAGRRQSRSRTPRSIATAGCCPATMSASTPARFGIDAGSFHAACTDTRRRRSRDALLATATHDHKRGEDMRARLAVLSEIPDAWQAAVQRWMRDQRALVARLPPVARRRAQLYQMIVGAWPLTLSADDADGLQAFAERLAGWQQKAVREAKLQGDWTGPNEAYEAAARDFPVRRCWRRAASFASEAANFVRRIAPAGAVNGLAQTLLRLTVPGVPDFFQGTEFWDFSLVDPDNRRPVDFVVRTAALRGGATPAALLETWRDGRVKQAVIARTLALRREGADLFARGDYRPLEATGPLARHVLAFLRVHGDRSA